MKLYKSNLIIRHFGAIKEINIAINKVNVIIGSQSSGKSTIVKVLSFCQWLEKRYIIEGKFNYTIKDMLQNFHRIGDEYFSKETYIEYDSEAVKISFDNEKKIKIETKDYNKYYKSKNIYIPAERNFATTIPNLGRYNETSDNILNLLYDWNDAKKQYTKAKNILNLDLSYTYNENDDEDYIHFNSESGKPVKMPLRFASSGLQSITPLVLLYDYLTDIFYEKNIPLSPFEKQLINEKISELYLKFNISNIEYTIKDQVELETNFDQEQLKLLFEKLKLIIENNEIDNRLNMKNKIANNISEYHFSRFIIEEPEQNLYPQTQKELMYYLLKKIVNSKREHQLTLTTHSPFILYSLNNCMIGGLIKDKMHPSEQKELNSHLSWIDPDLVSVWQLEKGELKSIKDDTTKVIGSHNFNGIMNSVMGEYFEMLAYFGK